jgi:mannose-6-phosphate isomerase-like protein (cupin superfamily)
MAVQKIAVAPVHLGLGASAVSLPPFDGAIAWYKDYSARYAADGAEGRLVSAYEFLESWTMWEMHPAGEELLIVTAGSMVLVQELGDGGDERLTLRAGDYVIIPRGIWHTADVTEPASALFITAGQDTVHRPR